MSRTIERALVGRIHERLGRSPMLLQVVSGPRQVGKTTAARQVADSWAGPIRYAAADLPLPPGPEWVETQWMLARSDAGAGEPLLVLDEVQKVRGWSESVKALWDEDRREGRRIHVLLLGSSSLLLARGATESLAGRFFLHRALHWSWSECRAAFDQGLSEWIYSGGYPGAAPLLDDEPAWRSYVADSLVETVLARDVIDLGTVRKPALLRHLFALAARLPARIVSYNKMLGQLTDAGNTTTLAHYLRILEGAFLLTGLERYSGGRIRSPGSSPKLVLWNNALVSALNLLSFETAREDPAWWGRLVENAVGAHLLNHLQGLPFEVTYWRERSDEVDYVVETGQALWAVVVKSGRPGRALGLDPFRRKHPRARGLIVGTGGMPLEEFFERDPAELLAGGTE